MRVLSLIHEDYAPSATFAEVAREQGHDLVEWNVRDGLPPGADEYDAYLVLGGAMHVDQEDEHPWLRPEDDFLRALVARAAPVLGVCLGSQLIAKAAGAQVGPAARPEIGWFEVGLTPEGRDDPVLGALPERFRAFQWHSYAFELPPGATALAESDVCLQAYRLGERAWGVQFHPEVTREIVERWVGSVDGKPERPDIDYGPMPAWTRLGRLLAERFLATASRR